MTRSDGVAVRVAATMTPLVIGIPPRSSLSEALAVMLRSRVRHLPIVENRNCIGILYESDALWELYLHEDDRQTAGQCARSPVPTIELDADITAAAAVLGSAGAEALIVLDRHGAISGILTATDIVRSIAAADRSD